MTGWWTGLGSEPTPFPGDQGSRTNTVWPWSQETPGKVPAGNGAVEYEDAEWSFHSACGFYGAASVFMGRRPGGGDGGSGDLGCKETRKARLDRRRRSLEHLEKKTNKKLAVECFLLTIVNS